jgi:hypothetical protein
VKDFITTILVNGEMARLSVFFDGDKYAPHNSQISDGLAGLDRALKALASQGITMKYTTVHKIFVADDDNEAGGLADCPELYSSRRIFRLLRFGKTEGNSNEKDNRVWGVGPVADFFCSDGRRPSWRRRRTRGAIRCRGVWTCRRRGGCGRGVYRRTIDCSFVGL